jgi:uncharacterized membrane protein YadS
MVDVPSDTPLARVAAYLRGIAPGLMLSAIIAVIAYVIAPLVARVAPIPALVIALIIGIALNPVGVRPQFAPGITFCVKVLLRCAVALLGLRIALGDIAALGWTTALLVIVSMAATILTGFLFARLFGQTAAYGALAGVGTAVCGASATLATATVIPAYKGKEADVVFVVVAVNALSTLAMVLYPALCAWLGFDPQRTGVMSDPVGNVAVIVKLFRVLLLFPAVVSIGWWFARPKPPYDAIKASVPGFAIAFIALCNVNSVVPSIPALLPAYAFVKGPLVEAAAWGLLIAIAALGLGTSLTAMTKLGWRHVVTVMATTLVILAVVTAGLLILR